MKETIIVDGKQFILTTDLPLTVKQKEQAIVEIRRQSGCGCGNKMANLRDAIQTLQVSKCADITMLAPANITVEDITIGATVCPSPGFVCSPDTIQCTNTGCTDSVVVVITWANSGDVSGTFTPTLAVTPLPQGIPTTYPGTQTTVSALSTATTTFSDVVLARGSNHVCIDSGIIT